LFKQRLGVGWAVLVANRKNVTAVATAEQLLRRRCGDLLSEQLYDRPARILHKLVRGVQIRLVGCRADLGADRE
jgi:hypothetical protein